MPINLTKSLWLDKIAGLQSIYASFDLSVLKNTYIKKIANRFNAQLRVEIFNAFNHANFAPPLEHHAVFDELGNPVSGAGLINSTQTPSRQVQLGLKLIW